MLYSHLLQYLGNSRRCSLIIFLLLERFPWGQQRCPKMRFCSSIAHFLGSTFFSFKYCSPFYHRIVHTYFHSSIAHLERFVQDGEFSWTVNSCGHFLMVITNGANTGGGHLHFKTQMDVAGSIFEPHPSNFRNQLIF